MFDKTTETAEDPAGVLALQRVLPVMSLMSLVSLGRRSARRSAWRSAGRDNVCLITLTSADATMMKLVAP